MVLGAAVGPCADDGDDMVERVPAGDEHRWRGGARTLFVTSILAARLRPNSSGEYEFVCEVPEAWIVYNVLEWTACIESDFFVVIPFIAFHNVLVKLNGVIVGGSVCILPSVCVCHSQNVQLCTVNKWLNVELPIFVHIWMFMMLTSCKFSSESSTSLTFILKIKDSHRAHWEVHTWFSRKWFRFLLAYLDLTFAHSKGQGQEHAHFNWISRKRWQAKHNYCPKCYVTSRLSISFLRVDLDVF